MSIQPIFILSLPRSGSTLLQRLLSFHPSISTSAEPWVLLPVIYSLREKGALAEYDHSLAVVAVHDFCNRLPEGIKSYHNAIRGFAHELYESASQDSKKEAVYFIDKTPRYHLIIEELLDIFPNAKFVLLWRNPLAIAASIMRTWAGGKWNLHHFEVDLYEGVSNLCDVAREYPERIYQMQYESLVTNPTSECKRVYEHLNLNMPLEGIKLRNNNSTEGIMGDKTGTVAYQSVSSDSLSKWKSDLSNPLRKAWGRRYIRWVGEERLRQMGYCLSDLLLDINSIKNNGKGIISDSIRMPYGMLRHGRQWR